MLDELRQIAIFSKTVDHGSFRAAADALRLSPSVVSHHVGQLEQRLGTALLYRSTRKLSLTPEGKRLLSAAHTMIEAAEAGLQDIADQSLQRSGELRVTVPAVLAKSAVTTKFAKFALAYPLVNLSIDFSDTRRELIADGYDVAIRVGQMQDSSLKAKKLFEIKRRLVAAPAYLEARARPKTPSDLSDWDWLELAPVWHRKPEFSKAGKRQTIAKRHSRLSANNAQALSQLACAGAGLALIPDFLAEPEIASGNLCYVIQDWTAEPLSAYAVWPSNAPKDGLVRHFIQFLGNPDGVKQD